MKKEIVILIIGVVLCITGTGMMIYSVARDGLVTVTYDDGTMTLKNNVKKGKITESPYTPTKEGYEFLGWYYKNKEFNFNKEVKEDMTLTAKWQQILPTDTTEEPETEDDENTENNEDEKQDEKEEQPVEKNEFTVKFNSNGGSSVSNQTIKKGGKVTKPSNPTRKNYDFINWYLNDKVYNFNTEVTKDMTLTAKWKFNGVYVNKVTLNKTSHSMNIGEKVTLTATVEPSNATNKTVTWTSSNKNVATVSNGTVTAVGSGTATITATADGKKVTCTITVIKPITYTHEIKDIPESTTGQCYIYVKSSEGKYVDGKVTITYINGNSETVNIPASGYMFPNRATISSITNATAN